MAFFTALEQKSEKVYGVKKDPEFPDSKAIFGKKNGVGEIRIPDFRLYYKATVIKTV